MGKRNTLQRPSDEETSELALQNCKPKIEDTFSFTSSFNFWTLFCKTQNDVMRVILKFLDPVSVHFLLQVDRTTRQSIKSKLVGSLTDKNWRLTKAKEWLISEKKYLDAVRMGFHLAKQDFETIFETCTFEQVKEMEKLEPTIKENGNLYQIMIKREEVTILKHMDQNGYKTETPTGYSAMSVAVRNRKLKSLKVIIERTKYEKNVRVGMEKEEAEARSKITETESEEMYEEMKKIIAEI